MYRDRGRDSGAGSSRHSHEGRHGRHSRDHSKKHRRESSSSSSRREREREKAVDPYLLGSSSSSNSNNSEEMQTSGSVVESQQHAGGGGGGGFEMGIPSSTANRRSERTSTSSWFHESPPAAGHDSSPTFATPTYLSALSLPAAMSECDLPLMGVIEDKKEPVPQLPLWHEGWKPGPIACTIPKLYEPMPSPKPLASTKSISASLDYPRDRDGNNMVLHCVSLQAYIRELKELLMSVSEDSVMDFNGLDNLPKKPVRAQNPSTKLPAVNPLCSPAEIPHLSLDRQTLNKLQRKSAAAICSFSGYESTTPDSLGILSDLLGSFLSNFSRFLKMNTSRHESSPSSGGFGFQDTLERSLQQVGVGGRAGLQQYWHTEVLENARLLEMEAEEYRNAYLTRTVPEERPKGSSMESLKSLSSPFVNTRLFPSASQDSMEQSVIEEEMPLDVAMQQSRVVHTAQRVDPVPLEVPPVPALPDSEVLDHEESFPQLNPDEPPRKRIRMVSFDQ